MLTPEQRAADAQAYQRITEQRDHLRALVEDLEANLEANQRALPSHDFAAELAAHRAQLADADAMIAAWRARLD